MQTPVYQWGKSFSDTLDLGGFQTILDVGCRQGHLSAYLASLYKQHRFIAIDNIETEIEQAKSYQLSNASFEIADALHLECDNMFDAVVSFSCLHWIKNKSQVLKNVYRGLKPGGIAYLQFFAFHGRPKNDRFIYQVAHSSNWKNYFKSCDSNYSEITTGECGLLLQKTGFLIHKLEITRYNTPFAHADLLQDWLGTWASQANSVPKRKRDCFLNDVVHSYLDFYNYRYDSPFPYYEYLLEIICEKPVEPIQASPYSQISLTKREQELLKHYLQGKTAKEIALSYDISPKTIEFHLANIKKKLNCYRRSEIHQAILSYGLIDYLL